MIKALIFDCFGVLYWDDLNRIYDLAGGEKAQDIGDLIRAHDHGYINEQQFFEQMSELTGVSSAEVETVNRNKQSPNNVMIARVKELRQSYKTSLLSNMGYDTLESVFSTPVREALFDDVLISGEVGLIKPSEDLYKLALERLQVSADEVIFIDDRLVNLEGAQRLGMKTILFTTNQRFEQDLERAVEAARA